MLNAESRPVSRRTFVRGSLLLLGALGLSACQQSGAAPATSAPATTGPATTAPAAKPSAASSSVAAGSVPSPAAAGSGSGFVPGQPVKLGFIVPQSGVYASSGAGNVAGFKTAIAEYEAKGWKFETYAEDEKADPTAALQGVQKLIEQNKVHALLGPLASNVLPALRDPVNDAKVVMSTSQAGTRDTTGANCSRYIFRTTPTNYMQSVGFGPWLLKNLGKKAYVLTADYAAGTELADGIVQDFVSGGGQVVQYAKAPLTTTDFAPYMGPVLSSGANFVTGFFAGQNAVAIVKAFQQFGVKDQMKIAYSGYLTSNDLIDTEGNQAVEGIYEYLDFTESIQTPEFQSWADAVARVDPRYKVPTVYVLHGYTAAKAVLAGIERAQSLDSEKLADAMSTLSIQGPAGPISFNGGRQSPLTMYVTQVKGGKHTVLDTVPNQQDPTTADCKL